MFDLTRRNNNNNHISSFNPFREMEEFENNFYNYPMSSFFGSNDLAEFKTDVTDEGDHYLMQADMPGFDKDDINLEINNDTLTLSAERHSNIEEKDNDKIIRMERSYGSYSRQFDISGINADGISAKYENGVLSLVLPKKSEELPEVRRLTIE